MNTKYVIFGIGEILWDVMPNGIKKLGGAPANFAYHASQFNLNSYIISAVGMDESGRTLLQELKNKNLNYLLEKTEYETGTVNVINHQSGEYIIKENTAWDHIHLNNESIHLAENAKIICFGSLAQRSLISQKTIYYLLDKIPENSFKIFDVNIRQNYYSTEVITNSLRKCNILKANETELKIIRNILKNNDLSELEFCRKLIKDYNLKIFIYTKRINGSHILSPEEEIFKETPKVKVVDIIGAGDAFTATFISALFYGKSLNQSHELAVKIAAYICSQAGGMPKIPSSLINEVIF